MNDIVTRLRKATVPRLEMGWPAPHVVQRKEPLWIEAADEIERLRAELAAAIKQRDEATAWRPIESAPMDGTVVMLYGDGRVTCGSWIAEQDITVSDHVGCYPSGETTPAYWQSHDGGFTEEHPPTHWMPLPQPPREKEGGGA